MLSKEAAGAAEADPRLRHWRLAKSSNAAMRHAAIRQMDIDPMVVEPITGKPYSANGCGTPNRPLDKISPEIVANVNMDAVAKRARALAAARPKERWASLLIKYYEEGFPRRALKENDPAAPSLTSAALQGKAAATVKELARATILKRPRSGRGRRRRTWASVFQVPKNEKVDRAIINCKLINKAFADAPPLSLAEIGTLVGLVKFFDDATISTADIRHFFWQLKVSELDRHYFSVHSQQPGEASEVLECVALPMGWSWSPWVAQGIAGLVVAEAVAMHLKDGG